MHRNASPSSPPDPCPRSCLRTKSRRQTPLYNISLFLLLLASRQGLCSRLLFILSLSRLSLTFMSSLFCHLLGHLSGISFFCYVHQVGYSRYRCAEGEPRFRHRFASVHGQFRLSPPPFPPFRARHCATSRSAPKHKIAISSPSSLKKPPTCASRTLPPMSSTLSISLCVCSTHCT
ncbi:hypothetical protein FA13DRAFT_602044 [Coprinellus micaceus]|uniref:Uncharacterized protein n=1 Tax=Coprinellus micaceus TaxID=71717 RepID=A0A4Y7T7J3_COPMI|nr:hypothetical protein FA13DRAFT_602044 [Coprinellus micaceus]